MLRESCTIDEAGGMHDSLHKMMGLGLIARVAALQVTLLLGLYLVDVFHSSVPSRLFFLFFKALIDLFAWGFWLPAIPPWGRLRKPMGIAMISTIAALPIWFPLGFFVLFSVANDAESVQGDVAVQPSTTHQETNVYQQAELKRQAEERKANAAQLAERRRKAQQLEAADRVARKAADEQRKKQEAEDSRRQELEAIFARVGSTNRAPTATYRDLSGLTREDLQLITDGDPQSSWTFTVHRTNPKFVPRGKAFKLHWQEPHTFNKVVLRQFGDNLRGITVWYLDPESNRWQQLCTSQWSLDPKFITRFTFYSQNAWRDGREHLVFVNGHSLQEVPRSLGHSGTKNQWSSKPIFGHPLERKA